VTSNFFKVIISTTEFFKDIIYVIKYLIFCLYKETIYFDLFKEF